MTVAQFVDLLRPVTDGALSGLLHRPSTSRWNVPAGKRTHTNKVPCHTDLEKKFDSFLDGRHECTSQFEERALWLPGNVPRPQHSSPGPRPLAPDPLAPEPWHPGPDPTSPWPRRALYN